MKLSFKDIVSNNKKNILLLLIIIVAFVVGLIFMQPRINHDLKTKPTKVTTTNTKYKGYRELVINYEKDIKYDLKTRYNFIYSNNESQELKIVDEEEKEYLYNVTLFSGKLKFSESVKEDNKFKSTSKVFYYEPSNRLQSFIIASTCETGSYNIIALDNLGLIHIVSSLNETNISDVIESFSIKEVKNKVAKIGYYDLGNDPFNECSGGTLVFLDKDNVVRYVDDETDFFKTAYYRYIGLPNNDNIIYVLNDGKMKFHYGDKTNLSDGEDLLYRGSFYLHNKENETIDVYLISKDGYLYRLVEFNVESSSKLIKMFDSKIKRVLLKNNSENTNDLIIEFADSHEITIESAVDFELLK